MATYSSILAWRIPRRTEEPGGLQSMGSQRAGHDRSDSTHAHTYARLSQNKPSVRLQLGSADSWIDIDLKAIRILSIITVLFVDLVFLPLCFFLLFISGFLFKMETLLLMTPELYIFQPNCRYSKKKKKKKRKKKMPGKRFISSILSRYSQVTYGRNIQYYVNYMKSALSS